ncbi:MAG: tRNA N6-adenosine threonylcarbamoyltransferase [Phycisphaerae bacterium]|nr:tRNA N6-adenosine threonylcarbamoyltransferase [Phycisphaerae bacterium]
MKILGIETSCDESAAAVVVDGREVLSNLVSSQIELHRKFEGVVPEIASRAHLEAIDSLIQQALQEAGIGLAEIDAVAVSNRPGLVGCLIIGLTAAKTLALVMNKPLLAVNHVHAHALSAAMTLDHDPWPAVALVVSGGHTSLYYVPEATNLQRLGGTTDDAAGEAFDKVASILRLGFPGGPLIDRLARNGNPRAVQFPRTLLAPQAFDFSFSGIKTAVLYHVHGPGKTTGGLEKFSESQIADIAASFQQAVVDVLITKTLLAAERTGVRTIVGGGGVVANSMLRTQLQAACTDRGLTLHLAPMKYCTDNGAMIAAAGYHLLRAGQTSPLEIDVYSYELAEREYMNRESLDEAAGNRPR